MQVHETPDGMIWVRVGNRAYGETRKQFTLDFGQEMESLEGFTERVYEPGVVHALKVGTNVVDGGPMPWKFGDRVLKAFDNLVNIKKTRERKILVDAWEAQQVALEKGWEELPEEIKARVKKPQLPPLPPE